MKQYIRGTVEFPSGNILNFTMDDNCDDMTISSQCVNNSGFSLGSVCSAELSMTLIIGGITRYDTIGAKVKPEISIDSETWHSLGVFNIASASRYYDNISFTAYDNVIWLDKSAYTVDENDRKVNMIADYLRTERTIYQVLKYVVEDISGLELAQSQAEIEAMPNGTLSTIVFQDITADCARDWLSWCAEFLGGFAYADENGRIAIKQFETAPTATILKKYIQTDTADIADFKVLLTGVRMSEVWDGSSGAIWNADLDGKPNSIYVDLSDNWIVQGKHYLSGNAMDILGAVKSAIDAIPYRPFQATVHSDMMYKLGQCIQIQDNDENFYSSVITHHIWTLNGGQNIECAGSDTRLLADTKRRTALKRESEKLQTMIENAKGKDVTQSELEQLQADGKLVDGTYYIID